MGIEDAVMKVLHRYNPGPTLGEAMQIVREREVQKEVLYVADAIRNVAIEINFRLQDLGHRPPLNHRGFLVGGLGISLVEDKGAPRAFHWHAFAAWNTRYYPKGHPEDQGKYCAEKRIGMNALVRKCRCIVCLAVVGELNEGGDGRSGKHGPGPTLDPCESCRDDMRGEFRSLYAEEGTIILTEHAVTRVRSKPRSVQELMDHHNETWWQQGGNIAGLLRGR
jgi:hypothetical protein